MTKQTVLDNLDALRNAVDKLPEHIVIKHISVDESYLTGTVHTSVRLESGARELAAAHDAAVHSCPLGSVKVSLEIGNVEVFQYEETP